PDAVRTRVQNLPPHRDRCSNVVPTRKLANRQNVPVAEENTVRGISAHYCREVYLQSVAWILSGTIRVEACKVRTIRIGASLQSTGYANYIVDAHVRWEWISPWLGHFALDVNFRRVDSS